MELSQKRKCLRLPFKIAVGGLSFAELWCILNAHDLREARNATVERKCDAPDDPFGFFAFLFSEGRYSHYSEREAGPGIELLRSQIGLLHKPEKFFDENLLPLCVFL